MRAGWFFSTQSLFLADVVPVKINGIFPALSKPAIILLVFPAMMRFVILIARGVTGGRILQKGVDDLPKIGISDVQIA